MSLLALPPAASLSPYVGMGNDPINGVDPNGGLFGPPGGPPGAGTTSTKGGNGQAYKSGSASAKTPWTSQSVPWARTAINTPNTYIPPVNTNTIRKTIAEVSGTTATAETKVIDIGDEEFATLEAYTGTADNSKQGSIFNTNTTTDAISLDQSVTHTASVGPLLGGVNSTEMGIVSGIDAGGINITVEINVVKGIAIDGNYTNDKNEVMGMGASVNITTLIKGYTTITGAAIMTYILTY